MSQTQPWLRYYVEAPDDKKIKRIALMSKCERILVNGLWAAILAMAKASPIEGCLLIAKDTPATIDEIADKAGTENIQLLQTIIESFRKLDMIEINDGVITLPHWKERQYKSDSSTPRVQDWRRKKKGSVSGNESGNVTPSSGCNTPETESDTEVEVEVETDDPADAQFTNIKRTIETITGLLPDHGAVAAIDDLIQMGATPADIQAGYNWLKGQNKNFRYYSMLVGPTRTALALRIGKQHPAREPTLTEEELRRTVSI
jgi:hypothetical protein